MRIIKRSQVFFADDKIEKDYNELDDDNEVKRYINRAIKDIQENAFCGIPIPKKLIPKLYIQKYKVNNLWKYDLPDGWRLVYTISTPNKIEILSIILEWFDHNDYEKRFGY